jgi:hypothetical protein
MNVLKVRSRNREELVEFTDQVQEKLRSQASAKGVVVLYVQHTTAGLTINENADPDVPRDMLHALRHVDSSTRDGLSSRRGKLRRTHQVQLDWLIRHNPICRWKVASPVAGRESFCASSMAAASRQVILSFVRPGFTRIFTRLA